MRWKIRFSKHSGSFALEEVWSSAVSDLSLKEGCLLVFKKTAPYTYLLTPFEKVHRCPTKLPMISRFTSISFERNFGCMDSFSHSFLDASKDVLWDSFDVVLQREPLQNCYFITDGWEKVVHYMGLQIGVIPVLRYIANYIFQLTVFDLNRCEIIAPKTNESPKGDTSSPKLEVAPITENMDHQSDVEETNDVDSDSDYVVSDESSDDGDDVDFDVAVSDYEVDLDVYPIESVWYYSKHFVSLFCEYIMPHSLDFKCLLQLKICYFA
ncbi:putative transcription factor B3-Domain family [Helianthus annuus]|nr:putative transcription factor B3-Domain family [Helianthus annuus]